MPSLQPTVRSRPILLVDDNPQDQESMIRAFRRWEVTNPIVTYDDGSEALDYLFRRGLNHSTPDSYPALIVLDLNMPGVDGVQMLENIKGDARLKKIPVIIMTTSASQQDIDRCYSAGANSYVLKPFDSAGLESVVETVKRFWLECTALPQVKG